MTWKGLLQALQHRPVFLNERLSCARLGQRPPLIAHPDARQPRRLYRPEWEADLMDLARVYAHLAQGRWFRKASNVGMVSLGTSATQRCALDKPRKWGYTSPALDQEHQCEYNTIYC